MMTDDNDLEREIGSLSRTELREKHPQEYESWKNMKSRRRHGAIVHPSISDFGDFLRLIGPMPEPGMTLDRIDPHDPEYSPDKCRWLTKAQQASNQRRTKMLTYQGETKPLVEWCRELGLKIDTVRRRFNKGGAPELILFGKSGAEAHSPEAWRHHTIEERWPWLGPNSAAKHEERFLEGHKHLETRYEFFAEVFGKDLADTRAGIAALEPLIEAYEAGKGLTFEVLEQQQALDMTWDEIFARCNGLDEHLEVLLEVQEKFDAHRDTKGAVYHRPEPLRRK